MPDKVRMYEVSSTREYLKQIDDAIFDLEEMVACATEDEGEELAAIAPQCQEIAEHLKALREEVIDGTHAFGNGKDLEYMSLARQYRRALPFYSLLDAMNETHRRGVDA